MVAIFVALVLSAFHAPSPHAVPVGIVAPATVTGQVEDALDASVQGGFDLRVYPSEAQALGHADTRCLAYHRGRPGRSGRTRP